MFENVDGRTDDGRRSHWYTNSSPWSLGSGELKRYYAKYGSSLKLTYKLICKAMLRNMIAHMTQPSDTKRHLMLKLKIWMK